ncbi:hypothetical protein DEI99_007735 [Curtobacterium sp. MCLR17_036]|uniref:hypothetical protein n=1 Tax=Curtobacterium sp. MCLR17_036 TaxID=2175620 RepID=UPI000DA8ABD6|nr:hypothetical protein [Curtobacterium sp. MCLR17_036]WIE66417.1 hypothetical protein DEI99_007735 [Curtobacterium sp. MCLR17_036]
MRLRSVAVAVAGVLLLAGCAAPGAVTTRDAPPWERPTDLSARAEAAGLRNVWGERLAEHVHTHLTILDGDEPVTVPANVGHSAKARFAAEIHTHDTSGIVHVESPDERTFTLGQFFDEWGVSLGPEHVGGLRGELTVWVDGHRRIGNPRSIALTDRRQVVLIVTTIGEVPRLPTPFDWPPQYR